jgi:hypothetical protein
LANNNSTYQLWSNLMEWWGHSTKYGWVFLDRTIKNNMPGEGGDLIFISCNTSEVILVNRNQWEAPMFVFEKRHLENIDEPELEIEKERLSSYKAKVTHYKQLAKEYFEQHILLVNKEKNSKNTDTPSNVASYGSFSEDKIKIKTEKPTTSNNNNGSNFLGKWLLFFIPSFIVTLIINQSAFGSCYSGYCISAAFPRVLIISIIISFFVAQNSD